MNERCDVCGCMSASEAGKPCDECETVAASVRRTVRNPDGAAERLAASMPGVVYVLLGGDDEKLMDADSATLDQCNMYLHELVRCSGRGVGEWGVVDGDDRVWLGRVGDPS